jgi:carbohydrate kinase (thermoresistant glucokinase family)
MTGDPMPPLQLVVMGVSGSGKSVIGAAVARALGISFIDGDDLHSQGNREKMASGTPLEDADRWPWLDAVGNSVKNGAPVVIACSALKRVYRDRIRAMAPDAIFLLLEVGADELRSRMESRTDHFMPPALLQSQLDLLEKLEPGEWGFTLENKGSVDSVTQSVLGLLGSSEPMNR